MKAETFSVADLEELLANEIPCGGNHAPVTRPCPRDATAIVVNWHGQRCVPRPQDFKCLDCYHEWLQNALSKSGLCYCICGLTRPAVEWYRAL